MKAGTIVKTTVKICVDISMTVLFLLLMGYHLLDGATHEWLGVTLFVLFTAHNVLNYKWYLTLFKGKYGAVRIIQTVINFVLIVAFVCCIVSAIYVSGYAFAWMNAGSVNFGRSLHLSATVWAFIFMAVHLGFHWSYFIGLAKRIVKPSATIAIILKWIFRIAVLGICAYGCYNFIVRKLWEEMFLLTEFKWFDFDKSTFLYFVESFSVMIMFTAFSYYLRKGILYISKVRQAKQNLKEN